MLGRLGGDMGQTLRPLPATRKAQPEQVLGRGRRLWPGEDGTGGWVQVQTQPQGLWPAPSPSPGSWETAETELRGGREKNEIWDPKDEVVREGRKVGQGGALSGMQPPTHSCPQLAPIALPIQSRTYPFHCGPRKKRHKSFRSRALIPGAA